jgi:hypothetical protein
LNFSKIRGDIRSSRCTTGVVDTGGEWKNSSIIKVLIILFGHLWEVELTYRYIFALKFTLRSQQPDSVPIICHWHGAIDTGGKFAAGFFDTGGKFANVINNTSKTGGKICRRFVDTGGKLATSVVDTGGAP